MARIIATGTLVFALLVSALVPTGQTMAQTALRLITQFTLNNTTRVKFPSVATTGDTVILGTNNDEEEALAFTKSTTADNFGNPFVLGDANTNLADWAKASVTTAPDGAIYATWIDNNARTVYLRRRELNGSWGPLRTVNAGGAFDYADVGVASDGVIFVVWREIDRPPRFRRSTDQGASWSGRQELSAFIAYKDNIDIATGPNGQVALTYTATGVEPISVVVGIWNGSNFEVSVAAGNAASSSITYGPDGKLYVAWRGSDSSGGNSGFFYAERQANNTYPRSRLVGGSVLGVVAIAADRQGGLHLSWIANPGRETELFYTYKPANGDFAAPIQASNGGSFISNIHGAVTISDSTYYHAVHEIFTGNTSRARYNLFAGGAVGVNATPTIEAGAPLTRRNDGQVSVSFQVTGPVPNQIRWRWGAAPNDTQFDSSGAQGWEAYANPRLIPLPERLRNVCGDQVLYTQVRVAGGVTELTAKNDAISFDGQVNVPGVITGLNPYSAEALNDPLPETAAELAASSANNAGDPKHTRIDAVNIELDNVTDCSGLDTVAIGKTATTLTTPDVIINNRFDKRIFFPSGSLVRGRNDYIIRIKDKAGNERDFNDTIFFDDEAPVLNMTTPGTVTITTNPTATLLVDLQFSNINVTDQVYDKGGRKFWGAYVAVSRTAVDPDASTLVWTPIAAAGTSNSFVLENFSLATGLPTASISVGDYFIYVRFLDGAGNATTGALSTRVTLTQVTRPQLLLPLIRK